MILAIAIESDDYNNIHMVVGDYYIKKIIPKIRKNFPKEQELELKFETIRTLILKKLKSEFYKEKLNNVNNGSLFIILGYENKRFN